MVLPIKLDPGATMPTRAYSTDAGLDLYAAEDVVLFPREYKTVRTGVHVELPKGTFGSIRSKSGLNSNFGVTADGVVDAGYGGEIRVTLHNDSDERIYFYKGHKVAQLIVQPYIYVDPEQVDEVISGARGDKGFGSSGR